MTAPSDLLLELLATTEFVAIITDGEDGPHVVGNWGEYVRRLSPSATTTVIPAGGYHQTEKNLARDDRIQLLIASREVRGSSGPGQGCLINGKGELITHGDIAEAVRRKFPWARGALVISVVEIVPQL